MRLWHLYALPKLPDKLLAALHRDVCNLRSNPSAKSWKSAWYYGSGNLWWYHQEVIGEMKRRGWRISSGWDRFGYRGKKRDEIPGWLLPEQTEMRMFFSVYYEHNEPSKLFQDLADIDMWRCDNGNV